MRKPIPSTDVQQQLLDFTQYCFIGDIPPPETNPEAEKWIRQCLATAPSVSVHDIATWPNAQRRAMYDVLSLGIIALSMKPEFGFPPGTLDGSTSQQLSQPLMRSLASVHIPTAG